MEATYTVKGVASRTGLTEHTIRAWERRYGALSPSRTESNRRLYTDADVARLLRLQRLVSAGHSIGQIAGLSDSELELLEGPLRTPRSAELAGRDWMEAAEECTARLDAAGLDGVLSRSAAEKGLATTLGELVIPFLERLGEGWHSGRWSIAQEHMASAVVRSFLERARSQFRPAPGAPKVVVGTPLGQHHELGAILAAISAELAGWDVAYVGASLPAAEISRTVASSGASVVALSLIYPLGDAVVAEELKELRRQLGRKATILVGGRAAHSYSNVLREIGAIQAETVGEIGAALAGAA